MYNRRRLILSFLPYFPDAAEHCYFVEAVLGVPRQIDETPAAAHGSDFVVDHVVIAALGSCP